MTAKGGRAHALWGQSGTDPALKDMVSRIFGKHKALARYAGDFAVIQGKPMTQDTGFLESYPPTESFNPMPGKATTELYSGSGTPAEQEQLVTGDMLHHLGQVDPQWASMKSDVLKTQTPQQLQDAQKTYEFYKSKGDPRTFDEFMNQSRGDEFLMGAITPDKNNQWAHYYTPEQRKKLAVMADYLIRGSTAPGFR